MLKENVGDLLEFINLHSKHIIIAQWVRVLIRLFFLDLRTKGTQLKYNPIKVGFLNMLESKDVEVFSTKTSKKGNIFLFT